MSKGPKTLTNTNQNTSTTTVDPTLVGRQNQLWDQANVVAGTPYQPYTGDRFAGFNPDQTASFDAARAASTAGQSDLAAAQAGTNLLSQYTPQQIAAQKATAVGATGIDPNTGQFNPLTMGIGGVGVGGARDVAAQTGPGGYQAYMNPFTSDVVNSSLGDIERARQETDANVKSNALAAGAFGGSRSGVVQALSNRNFAQTAASTAAQLRSAGFDKSIAANAADQNRNLVGQQSNQAADLTRAGLGVQAGLGNSQNLLQAAMANANNRLAAGGINADTSRFNAGQANTMAGANADRSLTADQTNAANGLAGGNLRLNALNLAGTFAGQKQAMGAAGADLLSRIGGQQQGLDQANKDFAYQQFTEARDKPIQNLDLLSKILGQGQYGSSNTSSSTSTQPNPNRGGLLSGLVGLAGLIPGIGGLAAKGAGALGIGKKPVNWSAPQYQGAQ